MPYQPGDRIEHKEFGAGTIKKVINHETDQSLLAVFDIKDLILHNGGLGPEYDNRCLWCSTAHVKPIKEVNR